MKLLIAVDKTREIYLKPFTKELQNLGIETTVIDDLGIYESTTDKKIFRWLQTPEKFKQIIKESKPDLVFTERTSHFCSLIAKQKIPYFIFLRGDHWEEVKIKTKQVSSLEKIEIMAKTKIAENCFKKSTAILPICNYLEKIVKKHYHEKPTKVLSQGIDIENWNNMESKNRLKHPCVGLLQGATIWGKTKEMLILPKILEALPEVTFYWAGDGPYKEQILPHLNKFENFHWLGALRYPNQVKEYLNEIDVYGLCTGLDMSPHTILEAGMMKKPIIASNIGGIPELIKENETGYLIEMGNSEKWVEKIQIALEENSKKRIGENIQKFVKENFSWSRIANEFVNFSKMHV